MKAQQQIFSIAVHNPALPGLQYDLIIESGLLIAEPIISAAGTPFTSLYKKTSAGDRVICYIPYGGRLEIEAI